MTDSEISGWLEKKGTGLLKSWNKRFFILKNGVLSYQEKQDTEARGTYKLDATCQVQVVTDPKKSNCFKINIPHKPLLLAASSADECKKWISTINSVVNSGSSSSPKGLNQKKASLEDFSIISVLGRGTYGKVQLVRNKSSGHLYALKSMSKQKLAEAGQVDQVLIEKAVLIEINHPFLVSAHFTFQNETKIFMVLDYVPGGELFGRLKEEKVFSEKRVKLYAAEILLGLAHLHKLGYIYRDLKPENILVDDKGHLKLTDFGLSRKVGAGVTATTFCGTPEYIAPEMLLSQSYDKGVDWWSFGILIYEMLFGVPAFYDENVNVLYKSILQDEVQFGSGISDSAKSLILKLLDRNPQTRLGSSQRDAEDIKEHPFFKELNWTDVMEKRTQPEWVPKLAKETDSSYFCEEFVQEPVGFTFDDPSLIEDEVKDSFTGFSCMTDSVIDNK